MLFFLAGQKMKKSFQLFLQKNEWRKFLAPKGVVTPKGRRSHTATVFQVKQNLSSFLSLALSFMSF